MSTQSAKDLAEPGLRILEGMIEKAPEEPLPEHEAKPVDREIMPSTKLPKRYRSEWERPLDPVWQGNFERTLTKVSEGGLVALIGPRGTGKTRLASEVMRNLSPDKGHYTTAMGLFLRVRASFGKKSAENEGEIVTELSKAPLLILDEIQERGNTAWEDRILTHILDRRYGDMIGGIVIANLDEAGLNECLGASIVSRLTETGGVLEISGESHRVAKGGEA